MADDTEPAPAKVNLYLHVLGRTPAGYHLLDSLAVFGPACDILHVEESDELTLSVVGPFAGGLVGDNLVLRAARALAGEAGIKPRACLRLDKRLPVASGIGGGSADAAATLRLLSRLWKVRPAREDLARIALTLGADVPVCLGLVPARMGGIGEVLAASPAMPEYGMLLVNGGQPVSTSNVFQCRTGAFSNQAVLPETLSSVAALVNAMSRVNNDLEAAAVSLCPVIADVLQALRVMPGCRLARMSGSGGTCFALFDTALAAKAAETVVPGPWWRCGGAPFTKAA